jgi:hypothetical protein
VVVVKCFCVTVAAGVTTGVTAVGGAVLTVAEVAADLFKVSQQTGITYITLRYVTCSTQKGVGIPLGAAERLIGEKESAMSNPGSKPDGALLSFPVGFG